MDLSHFGGDYRRAMPRSRPAALLFLACIACVAAVAHSPKATGSTARTVATGTLAYRILGPDGTPVPGRLTVLSPSVDLVELGEVFTERYAVREDVCYTLDGAGLLRLPAGEVEIVASRGLEWTIDRRTVTVPRGGEVAVDFEIAPAVDTSGLVGGDFHLHTLTHSGHGDSNMPERIVSLVGEGVELAIATDHNRNIDYRPTMASLGATDAMTAIVGNEVSTPIGHFNAWPFDAERPPVESRIPAGVPLFRMIRMQPNPLGLDPVIQVNHPRWNGIDYFSQADLDETTGTSDSPRWSPDFDAIEVLNENNLWGWFEPEDAPPLATNDNTHSAMLDWYALLDTGHRAIATGNSDSHSVKKNFAGVPRNYLVSSTDDPAAIDPAETLDAIRRGEIMVTSGPIVRASVRHPGRHDDLRMATARDGHVTLDVEVQAAPWIDCDRIRVVRDGEVVVERAIDATRDRVRFDDAIEVPIEHDSWIVVLVDGDEPLDPIVSGKARPVLPVAIVNPFRIDADGDGVWTPPMDRVANAMRVLKAGDVDVAWRSADASERRRMIAATRRSDVSNAIDRASRSRLIELGLADDTAGHRLVRLAACRAIRAGDGEVGDGSLATDVIAVLDDETASRRTIGAAVRALATIDAEQLGGRLPELVDRHGVGLLRDLGEAGLTEIAGPRPEAWLVTGPFDRVDDLVGFASAFDDATTPPPASRDGGGDRPGGWETKRVRPNGLLSFKELSTEADGTTDAIAVATGWLISPRAMMVPVLFGSDDGAVVRVNGVTMLEDRTTHGASPFGRLLQVPVRAGANRVVIAVENGTGDFGFHFRPVHRDVTLKASIAP